MNNARNQLSKYIQVFDNALEVDFCAKMIDSFNTLQRFHRPNGADPKRGLDNSAWIELDVSTLADPGFKGFIFSKIDIYLEKYNAALDLTLPIPASQSISELIIKRYRPDCNESFQPHFDSVGSVANRYLVFLWYLNDVAVGGQTRFVDIDLDVVPKAGRLLIFPPYWMFQHQGMRPQSNDKFIFSTYLLFK